MTATKLKTKAKTPPETRRLGYARVSTYGQTLDAQLEQLRAEGCARIYREKATGVRPDRRELLKLLKAPAPGDVVTVTRIDRLARSTFDLFAILKQIVAWRRICRGRRSCRPAGSTARGSRGGGLSALLRAFPAQRARSRAAQGGRRLPAGVALVI